MNEISISNNDYFSKNDVLFLMQKAYKEGSCGFEDLYESVTNAILEDFLEKRKISQNINCNTYTFGYDKGFTDASGISQWTINSNT